MPCRLRDESTPVRKNTLLVLAHLILNDMIKVKGQISEMATCIIDDNTQIAGLARIFFSDLAKRVSLGCVFLKWQNLTEWKFNTVYLYV